MLRASIPPRAPLDNSGLSSLRASHGRSRSLTRRRAERRSAMCPETLTPTCFGTGDKILPTVVVYCFLVVGFRLAGKRELGQFTSFDLIVLILIANPVQNGMMGPAVPLARG